MTKSSVIGYLSSVESLGTVDGPGVRFVAFLKGCSLRCLYCHNPETWADSGSVETWTPSDLVKKILRFKNYFADSGGVTFSGGEPLLQADFLLECLKLLKAEGIHTCIDTAGVGRGNYDEILKYTDLVILDIKAVEEDEYKKITGQTLAGFNEFADAVRKNQNKVWLRQVIVPGINDDEEHVKKLKEFSKTFPNVEKIELLPYRTFGVHKYEDLKIDYPLMGVPEMDNERVESLTKILNE